MRALSLFAGIEGFGLAFVRAGFELVGSVELDPACRRLLEVRFPGVPLWSDIREVHGDGGCERVGPRSTCPGHLPAVDVLVGGWPCQPFSVAGRRRGTDDERDLWPEFARLVGELRPRWVVGENVPGLLSIDEGRVWGRTVTDLSDLGYGVCWRVLDAQHFGVPQRRRRIFVVAHLGDLAGPAQILFEPESGSRDSASRRETGSRASSPVTASTLQSGGGRGWRTDAEGAGGGILSSLTSYEVARPLKAGGNDRRDESHETYIAAPLSAGSNPNSNAAGRRREDDLNLVAAALTAREGKGPDSDATTTLIAHTLSAEGSDASEDGTGRGTPLVVQESQSGTREYDTAGSLRADAPGHQPGGSLIGFYPTDGRDQRAYEDQSPALKDGTGLDIPSGPTVAYGIDAQAWSRSGDADSLSPDARGNMRLRPPGLGVHEEVSPTVNATLPHAVAAAMQVRRLTPTECERLQGFPDGWTDGQPDSTRYRQLGNAVAVPVVEWIARRLAAVEAGDA